MIQIKGCVEVKDSFGGKRLPKSVRFFDVRAPDGEEGTPAPWTESFQERETGNTVTYTPTLWSGERTEASLGLRARGIYNGSTPLHCTTYLNHRTLSEERLGDLVMSMRKELAHYLRRFRKAKQNPSLDGGSVLYKPVALSLANFGWSLLCDNRENYITQATW